MKEKNKKGIIICLIIIIVLLTCFIIYLLTNNSQNNTKEKERIIIYRDAETKEISTSLIPREGLEEAFTINVKSDKSYVLEITKNYIIYRDTNIYLYDIKNNISKRMYLDGINPLESYDYYESFQEVRDNKTKELIGFCYTTSSTLTIDYPSAGFYNVKTNQNLYEKRYDDEGCPFRIMGNNYLYYKNYEDGSVYLYNSEEEKLEISYKPSKEIKDDYIAIEEFGYDNDYIYALIIDSKITKLYSNELKVFYDEQIDYNDLTINKDEGTVLITSGKEIKEYSFSGEFIKTYTKEEKIISTYDNYYLYKKDNKLILENIKDNTESVTLTSLSNKWSVYFEGNYTREELDELDETNKKAGLYITIEYDKKDSKGNYGMEYCYTEDKKVIEYPIKEEFGGRAKPVLYLYPTEKTNIKVTFEHPEYLTTTYPKYNNSWNVTAYPNGDLYDKNGKYYYALYWDEARYSEVSFNEGFYVEAKDAIRFLEEKLTIIGLNQKEKNEFIMYWLPILEKNKKSIVYFELTEKRELNNKLIINPTPDSLLRVNIHIKKVEQKTNIKEQKLNTFKRFGFTAVEWGGMTY